MIEIYEAAIQKATFNAIAVYALFICLLMAKSLSNQKDTSNLHYSF